MRKVVAGNWKMHHGPRATAEFLTRFQPETDPESVRLILFVAGLSLHAARVSTRASIGLGVQNLHWESSGALTGEVSAEMAREAGASYALVGHSERRHVFGETDVEVGRKAAAAVRAGLVPVACVGESLEERRERRLAEVLRRQVAAFLPALRECGEFMVAYEPVWAIGTGETATPEDASAAHAIVRAALGELEWAPILYGGSVNPGNAEALMCAPDVDGVLVGGASLDPETFARIAEAGNRAG